MTDKELMVNDFVLLKGKVALVETIWLNSHAVKLIVGRNRIFRDAFLTDIEPISITPEILEANGFENNQLSSRFRIDTKHFLEFNSLEKELILWEEKSVLRTAIFCARVDYIHELQHALRLCKIEKEIRL